MELRIGRHGYDLLYRTWAPWDVVGVRPELVEVLDRDAWRLSAARLADEGSAPTAPEPPRALDVGCGTGANVVHLAASGFEVTAVDFSAVALDRTHRRARAAGLDSRCRILRADLTADDVLAGEDATYDLLIDASTLDDLDRPGRRSLAGHLARLARPGATLLSWCFYAHRRRLPAISLTGPSRVTPGLEPGQERELFGDAFDVIDIRPTGRHEVLIELRRRAG